MFTRPPSSAWIVVPFSRPTRFGNVFANAWRQTFPCKLVIVANGDGRRSVTSDADLLLTSDASPGAAKNEAIAAIRKRGGGFFVVMDDDDWYGAGYVAELARHAHRANVVGKRRHLVQLSDGVHLFDEPGANRPTDWVTGGCTAGWAEDAAEFQHVPCGEDAEWCRTMIAKGATMWATSVWNFVYERRGSGHAWEASDTTVRRAFGESVRFDQLPTPAFVPAPSDREVLDAMQAALKGDPNA